MSDNIDISEPKRLEGSGQFAAERQCAVLRESFSKQELIRFVISPDGIVTPDVLEKLPGRGVWVRAKRDVLQKAISGHVFARAFKTKAKLPDNLLDMVEFVLTRRLQGLMAMAMKSGDVLLGFDQVMSEARMAPLAFRIEARDGSEGGRGKIRALSKAIARELDLPPARLIGCFDRYELGEIWGREHVVHAAIRSGRLARALKIAYERFSGFCEPVPQDWPDIAHESFGRVDK